MKARYYLILNEDMEVIQALTIEQTANRPNDPDDDEIISDYVAQNHFDILGTYRKVELFEDSSFVSIGEDYCIEV